MTNVDEQQRDGGTPGSLDPIAFAREAARLAVDLHCEDVRLLDVSGLSQLCDVILVASGTSDRQMRSVAAELEALGRTSGFGHFRSTSDPLETWIVVDFVDLVAHLFEPGRRSYYDLETLWADATDIDFDRPGSPEGNVGDGTTGT
ncbi:MAG: ribosome silencing factor [Phycisphaerales bacterium]|nr:ribosome silencing factor [Phycisphaerales bacterium]